jgi:hypothetical protein
LIAMQPPTSPPAQRLRLVRRRVTLAAVALLAALWLAVAALGKGGSATKASPAATPSGTSLAPDAEQAPDADQAPAAPGPLTTSQS